MSQKDFTNYVVPKFRQLFHELTEYTVDDHENVRYLELPSPHKKMKLLISTRDNELTIGFSAGPGLFGWHVHLPTNEPIDDQIKKATSIMNDIIDGKNGIIYSNVMGYFPGNPQDLPDVKMWQQPDEIVELLYWRDL